MKKLLTTLLLLGLFLPLLAQNPDFDRKYQVAKSLYEKGKFEDARRSIQSTLKNLPSLSASQIHQGNQLVSQCDQAIAVRDRLDLSITQLSVPFGNSQDSVSFVAAKPNLVSATSSAPDWCQVEKVEDGKVFLRTQMNPNKSPREAEISVAMGRIKNRKFKVIQEARPETIKLVRITTQPNRGRLIVDGSMAITGVWEGKLEAGNHRIRAEKSGYFPKDTTINVLDDMKDNMMEFIIPLKMEDGRIRVEVLPEEGFSFHEGQPVNLSVNGRRIENDNYSYDDDRDVMRYTLYEDGTIPVPVGKVTIVASTEAFERGDQELRVNSGEIVSMTIILKAKFGHLSLIDAGQADNAQVSIDGKPIGPIEDITDYILGIGEHQITLEKEGYVSEESSYTVDIKENGHQSLNVAMFRYVPYVFESTPTNARVLVDGEYIGNTPTEPYMLKEFYPNQPYKIEVAKDGFLAKEEMVYPDYDNPGLKTQTYDLSTTYKLTIAADEPNLKLVIKDKKDGTTTFVDGELMPAEVALPLSDDPYYLELYRIGKRNPVYKKKLLFNNPDNNQYKFRTWGGPTFLSTSFFVLGPDNIVVGEQENWGVKRFRNLGTANLVNFELLPGSGLSTSAFKALFFLQKDKNESYAFTAQNPSFLPGISVLLLNADFRLGATVFDWDWAGIDANVLVSYAWYPSFWKQFLRFSHLSGHDIFLGAEIASRRKYINLGIKAGYQMYPKLTAQLYNMNGTKQDAKENYVEMPVNIPGMFVVGIELSLGGKGKPLCRVWSR